MLSIALLQKNIHKNVEYSNGFKKNKGLHQAESHHTILTQGEGKYSTETEAPRRATDAGKKESPSCGVSGG